MNQLKVWLREYRITPQSAVKATRTFQAKEPAFYKMCQGIYSLEPAFSHIKSLFTRFISDGRPFWIYGTPLGSLEILIRTKMDRFIRVITRSPLFNVLNLTRVANISAPPYGVPNHHGRVIREFKAIHPLTLDLLDSLKQRLSGSNAGCGQEGQQAISLLRELVSYYEAKGLFQSDNQSQEIMHGLCSTLERQGLGSLECVRLEMLNPVTAFCRYFVRLRSGLHHPSSLWPPLFIFPVNDKEQIKGLADLATRQKQLPTAKWQEQLKKCKVVGVPDPSLFGTKDRFDILCTAGIDDKLPLFR